MNELVRHIQNLNTESAIWAAQSPDRWPSALVEDPEHWASYGIYTVDQFEQYMAQQIRNEYELQQESRLCKLHGTDTEALVRKGILQAWTPWRSEQKWVNLDIELNHNKY